MLKYKNDFQKVLQIHNQDRFFQGQQLDDLEQAEYADYYIKVKNEEWRQYHNTVSEWEADNYLGLY